MKTVHATAVAIDGNGVLLRGPSGCGKSDLALRLMDAGGVLVSDDRVEISVQNESIIARVPKTIAGKLEVRGFGIVQVSYLSEVPITLIVDLVNDRQIERLPENHTVVVLGQIVRTILLNPFDSSAVAKLKIASTLDPIKIEK
ncbi:MAG: HPr kinase/phosphorylase [Candidatus Latescibacterota bacterium]